MSQDYNQRPHIQSGRSNSDNRNKMDRECPDSDCGLEAESKTSLRVDSKATPMRHLTGHSLPQKMDTNEVLNGA